MKRAIPPAASQRANFPKPFGRVRPFVTTTAKFKQRRCCERRKPRPVRLSVNATEFAIAAYTDKVSKDFRAHFRANRLGAQFALVPQTITSLGSEIVKNWKLISIAGALTLGLAAPFAYAGTITIGTGTGGNAFPFVATSYVGEYQQIYDGTAFSGPVDITQISFFHAPGITGSISGNFTLSFSTTSASILSPSTVYSNNIGADNSVFFSGAVSNVLSFTGTPFFFDPSKGNLLLDVFVNTSDPNQSSLAAGCSTHTNRVFNFFGNSTSHGIGGNPGQCTPNSYGLETQFTFTAIPEPSSQPVFGAALLSLLGLGVFRRSKRA